MPYTHLRVNFTSFKHTFKIFLLITVYLRVITDHFKIDFIQKLIPIYIVND